MTDRTTAFASVWDALSGSPTEAANMRALSELAIAIRTQVEGWATSQAEAAAQLGLTQPRLNDLLRGRLTRFSLDALLKLAGRAGLAVQLDVQPIEMAA